jgi:hypothetical protein
MTRSDPYDELPQRSEKYAGLTTDLHMGRKGISELWDFENFVNLHTLWLNDNHLYSLEGLERNVRLLHLHCHGNKIGRISETLRHLKFLSHLTLNQNLLTDIEEVIVELRHLRNITYLDLFENPITQEDNYRLRLVAELPWVQVLDKHEVTEEERKQAKKVLKKILKAKNVLNKKNKAITLNDSITEKIIIPDLSLDVVEKLKKPIAMHRVFLEKYLMVFDPQKRGIVESSTFLKVCHQYGLLQELNETDIESVVARYTSHHPHHTSSHKSYIDYPEFCRLIQPNELRTMRFDQWKMEPCAELSRGAADLDRFVNTIVKKRAEANELEKSKALMSSPFGGSATMGTVGTSSGTAGDRSATAPGTMNLTSTLGTGTMSGTGTLGAARSRPTGPRGMDSWLSSTVRALVKTIAKEAGVSLAANGTTVPSIPGMESIGKVLSQMKMHGKAPVSSAKAVKANVQALLDAEGKMDINMFCEVVGCAPVVHVKKAPESAAAPRKMSNRKPVPQVTWVDMAADTQHHVESDKFNESASYLDALLRSGKGVDTKALFEGTMKSATVGTRLMSTRDLNPKPPPVFTPAQIVAAEPDRRADVIFLPRLLSKKGNNSETSLITDTGKLSKSGTINEEDPADMEAVWRKQFMALGLKRHELEFAIDRKKRSQTSKGVGVSSLSKSAANAYYGTRPASQGEFIGPGHKSNWNTATGTFLLTKK